MRSECRDRRLNVARQPTCTAMAEGYYEKYMDLVNVRNCRDRAEGLRCAAPDLSGSRRLVVSSESPHAASAQRRNRHLTDSTPSLQ